METRYVPVFYGFTRLDKNFELRYLYLSPEKLRKYTF